MTHGVFVLQDVLPDECVPATIASPFINDIIDGVYEYHMLAYKTKQPAALSDIERADQNSELPDGKFVLHDIEPAYRSVDQLAY